MANGWEETSDREKKQGRSNARKCGSGREDLMQWAGDDPNREGLRDTPKRVVNAYRDWFSGYSIDPV